MDPNSCAQDVLQCHLCETDAPRMHCDICRIHLCKTCVGEHLLDESKEHKVVPFKKRGFALECIKHSTKICELQCEQCNIPICLECVASGDHLGHLKVQIVKTLEAKKEILRNDLHELEKLIFPQYQEMLSKISVQKADLKKNSHKIKTAISKHEEDLHREIDDASKKLRSDVDEMESKHLVVLLKREDELTHIISEITQSIADLKKILNYNEFNHVSAYKSRNTEFRRLPPELGVSLLRFCPQDIDKERIYQLFGSVSALTLPADMEDNVYEMIPPFAIPSSLNNLLIDDPWVITDINTSYGDSNKLRCVSGLSDDEFWASGQDNMIKLYNLQGELVKLIETKSGKQPWDIAVTQSGELVYTDLIDKSVNIVKNKKIKTLIRPRGWKPSYFCSASAGDLLVVMISDDKRETKVVRYSGTTEKQTIQYNDRGQPLYSSDFYPKYITENKNLDICVADNYAHAIVVVNQAGKLRFTYTGPPSTSRKTFKPAGIATDSQSRILTADTTKNCIVILDLDGQFLRYIDNCHLDGPCGLYVDTKDNLFVAQYNRGKVKKIGYYK